MVPPNHDLRILGRQIDVLASESSTEEDTALAFSQRIVQLLFKTPTQLGREVYVTLLDGLCNVYDKVANEALGWLIYAEDDVRISSLSPRKRHSHNRI